MEPLISVIIPAYNCQNTLKRALDSVIYQSYTNLEIIIVDDGSIDDTPALCDSIAATDDRISVIHKQNGRQASARNAGLKVCKGEYILFLDSDDEFQTNCCEIVTKHLSINPDFVLFGFNVYKNGKLLRTPTPGNAVYRGGDWGIFKEHFKFLMPSPCNKLYKKSYIKTLFDESCVHGEDGIFNYANFTEGTIAESIDYCLYNVYLDNENSVNKSFKRGRLRDGIKSAIIRKKSLINIFDNITNADLDSIKVESLDTVLGEVYACCVSLTRPIALEEINSNINDILNVDLFSNYNSSRLYLRPLKILVKRKCFNICYIYCRYTAWVIRIVKIFKGKFFYGFK